MPKETERKWIADEVPSGLPTASSSHFENRTEEPSLIDQWYTAAETDVELRLRQRTLDETFFEMGIKRGQGQTREEFGIDLSEEQALELIKASVGKVRKVRHQIMWDGLAVIELDLYRGELNGLAVAEIENPPEDLEVPEWFGREVTEDRRFKNKNLATRDSWPSL